jgi:hypothetical protein
LLKISLRFLRGLKKLFELWDCILDWFLFINYNICLSYLSSIADLSRATSIL